MLKRILLSAVFGGAVFAAICAMTYSAHSTTGASYDEATVTVLHGKGNGSGVYIGHNTIVTAKHVVEEGLAPFGMHGASGATVAGTVTHIGQGVDLAFLKVDAPPKGTRAGDLACGTPDVVVGDELEIVGAPVGKEFVHTWGRVAKGVHEDTQEGPVFFGDITVAPGNSGGPAFHNGKIAGIVVALLATQLPIQGPPMMQGAAMRAPALFPITLIIPRSAVCAELHRKPIETP